MEDIFSDEAQRIMRDRLSEDRDQAFDVFFTKWWNTHKAEFQGVSQHSARSMALEAWEANGAWFGNYFFNSMASYIGANILEAQIEDGR